MKMIDSALDRAIEKAEYIAEYDDAHKETREYSAEQRQLALFLKELRARREAWEEMVAALKRLTDRYSGSTDTYKEAYSLLSTAERLEKEFSKYQEVEDEE